MNITCQRAKYTSRVVKFASQVLFSMWQHQELREVYRKSGWKESDFVGGRLRTVVLENVEEVGMEVSIQEPGSDCEEEDVAGEIRNPQNC